MALVVQKFGGTSVASIEHIERVAKRIAGYRDRGDEVVVVVSAMRGDVRLVHVYKQNKPVTYEIICKPC